MRPNKKLCLVIPLTNVTEWLGKEWTRHMRQYLETSLSVSVLFGDFDENKWEPKNPTSVFKEANARVRDSDLVVIVFSSNAGLHVGSDGRGGQMLLAQMIGRPMIAFAVQGVKISPYAVGCLEVAGVKIIEIAGYRDMEQPIREKLKQLEG